MINKTHSILILFAIFCLFFIFSNNYSLAQERLASKEEELQEEIKELVDKWKICKQTKGEMHPECEKIFKELMAKVEELKELLIFKYKTKCGRDNATTNYCKELADRIARILEWIYGEICTGKMASKDYCKKLKDEIDEWKEKAKGKGQRQNKINENIKDTVAAAEKPEAAGPGGITLNAAAEFIGNIGRISGAVYDPEKQVLTLIGEGKNQPLSSIKAEDLAVALMSVFGSQPQDPQFSLDPADPKNPEGEWLKAVYIPERIIAGTEFGKALFDADWLLKQYSFGIRFDENKKPQKRVSSVAGFKSSADLFLEEKTVGDGKKRWARFWIVSDEIKLKQSDKGVYFDSVKMRVKAKKQVPDPSSTTGLKDIDTEDDPVATRFVNKFTELYDEIAKESPEFERVRELAKAVAIAKWIKKEKIPLDAAWVNEYANKRIKNAIGKITAISLEWEKKTETPFQKGNQAGIETRTQKLHLFGGVDLTVKPRYISDDGTAKGLQGAVMKKLREKTARPTFTIIHSGKPYKAVVLPITQNGQEIWKGSAAPLTEEAK